MSKKPASGTFGGSEYQRGALERLQEAHTLLYRHQFAGTVYLGGRAVEGMLRAVIWHSDKEIQQGKKSLETGHDLRELLHVIRDSGLLRSNGSDDEFEDHVQRVGRLWFNNLRFASSRFLETRWWMMGEVGKRRTLKQAAFDFYDSCTIIVRRCEVLCG